MIGYEILAESLRRYGVKVIFFLMGGPMIDCANACETGGIRMIAVRHEQAAAMMATAYSRLRREPAVCMAASGPGSTNLITGVANAFADGSPVIAIGGSSPLYQSGTRAFQETDQVSLFKPITRWADRCYETTRIPEYVDMAFRMAFGSHPGPVYLDMPGDVLYRNVSDPEIQWKVRPPGPLRPHGDPIAVEQALAHIAAAERPALISGTGVLWSKAEDALLAFVERSGMPFWSTPQGRGAIPEDHPLSFLGARSTAFRECDLIVQVATRQNYVIDNASPPRWSAGARLIQIDIDPEEIGRHRYADVGIAGDARSVLEQFLAADGGRLDPARVSAWTSYLAGINRGKLEAAEKQMSSNERPIHPLRLCKEVRDWLPRDAVLVVDGQEILTYARQSIPFYMPRSLNSGPYGCMGVGLPLGVGAKVALPDAPVVILHGDGSFGLNAMEMDTALRYGLPLICIISNNGGWTATHKYKAGRDLGFTRYDRMFEGIGAFTRHIEDAADLRPALESALRAEKPALLNVITDPTARAGGVQFVAYST